MNIQEYISSGIVESYVLGFASAEEKAEFEQLCSTNAELRQAKEAFEISLEKQALDNAMPAPAALKQKIWDELNLVTYGAAEVTDMKPSNTRMQPLTPVRSVGFSKLLAAASVLLLIASTLLNFYYYNQYKSSAAKLNELIAQNEQMASNNTIMQTKLQQYEFDLSLIKDTNMAVVAMKGQPVAPQGFTTVYWNKQTKDVYLMVNALPQPAADKQYQLWAIVDGKPVSAGLLNPGTNADAMVKMANIPNAQAFAITLENKGGSKTPTMPIYVVGKT